MGGARISQRITAALKRRGPEARTGWAESCDPVRNIQFQRIDEFKQSRKRQRHQDQAERPPLWIAMGKARPSSKLTICLYSQSWNRIPTIGRDLP
jgi:hypothetical protein